MAHKDFKTLYTSEYSTQGTLANDLIPEWIDQLRPFVGKMMEHDVTAFKPVLSWYYTTFPMLSKFIPNYDQVKDKLKRCKQLMDHWLLNNPNMYPTQLEEELYELYEEWWTAFNNSGAGLRFQVYDPRRNVKIYNELIGKPNKNRSVPVPGRTP